ncbi:MAG: deoxyribodipyrimidine photo-lyase [Solirubrobacteraceae bacterium]
MPSTAIVWLRRDLRLHDHPALHRALREFDRVVMAFVLDNRLLTGRFASEPRTAFMVGCLLELGDGLVVRRGAPERVIPALAKELSAGAVLWTSDVSAFARSRDRRVSEALEAAGVDAVPCGGNYVVDIGKVKTKTGKPYTVFSPFWRTWQQIPRRAVHRGAEIEAHGLRSESLPQLSAQLEFVPGEAAARDALAAWLADGVDAYDGEGRTSGLSPYLRWGCLSPRECEDRALRRDSAGAEAWVRQLCWRDFFAHVLLHHPDNAHQELQPRLRALEWAHDEELLAAWQEGRTGFPLVDAGMRQLARTGWMHNRARLVVGSFLTKDLHLDWRAGELHFQRLLLDGEPAQNNGNWQWIASVGVDPAPAFRRIFNPTLQAQKFDPDGDYIRRWVPELGGLSGGAVHDPSTEDRLACGYPDPIVDHAVERRRALERYAAPR